MRQARSLKDQAQVKAAMTAQIAVAVAILTAAPVRASNLAAIRLGENLNKPGGPDTSYLLVFPEYDVKNQVDLTFELDEYVTAVIDEYVHDYRPALMRGSNEDWLFPGGEGGAKNARLFGIQITDRIQKDRIAHHVTPVPPCGGRCLLEAPSRRLRDGSALPGPPQHQDNGQVLLRSGDHPSHPDAG